MRTTAVGRGQVLVDRELQHYLSSFKCRIGATASALVGPARAKTRRPKQK
jgi:hypothetical protein